MEVQVERSSFTSYNLPCINIFEDLDEFLVNWSLFKQKLDEDDEEEDEIREAFKLYDQDGDGYITKDEMLSALTQMGFVR